MDQEKGNSMGEAKAASTKKAKEFIQYFPLTGRYLAASESRASACRTVTLESKCRMNKCSLIPPPFFELLLLSVMLHGMK